MKASFMLTTQRQNCNLRNGSVLGLQDQKKARMQKSKLKTMFICFFDQEGIVHREFVPPRVTVNADFYCDVLRRLRENMRRKRPQKWQNQNLIIHHDNAPAHRSFKVSQFLAKNNMTVVPQPPYSPDLAPWFFFFPKLKLRMKGRRFDTIEEIHEVSQRVLDNSKKGLPGMFPSMAETLGPLYSCKRGVLWRW